MKSIPGSVVVVASLVLVAGCSGVSTSADSPATVTVTDTDTAGASSDSSGTSTSSSSPTRTTATATATETATATSGGLPTGVGEYADAFVRAWGIGDKPDASRYATVSAVRDLFGQESRGGSDWSRRDSVDQGTRTQVRYTDDSGMTLYVLVDRATAGAGNEDAVVGASLDYEDWDPWYDPDEGDSGYNDSSTVTGLPSTVTEYADAMVRAWGVDDITMDDYATDEVFFTLYDEYGSGGSNWSRSSSTSSTVTYRNTDGSVLVLTLDPSTVSAGRGDGITGASFS